MKTIKSVTCTIVIGLMLITQLIHPTRAQAGGGSPLHPTETIVPTKAPTKPPVTETPVPTEMPATTTTVAPEVTEEPIQEPTTTKPANSLEILQNLPVKIRVVALNENGQVLPLAGEEAAAVIAEGDPVWCPAGQAPTPGANGCTASYTTLGDLIVAEGANINADGTIWITTGVVADAGPVTIDGLIYTNWANNALTLHGGWDGITGSTTIASNSVFSVPITITNWNNGIIIQNIDAPLIALSNVTVSNGNNVSVGNENDIYGSANIHSNVTMDNIRVTDSTRTNIDGYYIPGIYVNILGAVTANNITASGNAANGVHLVSSGNITLSQITANGNSYIGAVFGGVNGITMTGTNIFNNNGSTGLIAYSTGNMNLNNITANGNGIYAYDTDGSGAVLSTNSGNITLAGTNTFNDNWFNGLDIVTDGNIVLSNVTANGNGNYVSEYYGGGWGANLDSFSGNITVTGTNTFNSNSYAGLGAYTYADGDIILNGVSASNNLIGLAVGGSPFSDGNLTLNNVTANENWAVGAVLYSFSGNITVTGEFNNNGQDGLVVISQGDFTLNNVSATGNNTDVRLFTPGNATINNSAVGSLDAAAVCGILALNHLDADQIRYPVSGEHTFVDPFGWERVIYCDPKIYVDGQLIYGTTPVTSTQYEFDLSCDNQTLYPVDLPNGDKVTIVCPVSGRAFISRLDNTTVPPGLPAGYTYASAFSVNIMQAGKSIPVITEGGHIEVSFQVPSQQEAAYSILYWDNDRWIPLNEFIGPESNPETFNLNPGVPEDLRKIKSGVKLVTRNGVQRAEVSTNFPGIFVLAQH